MFPWHRIGTGERTKMLSCKTHSVFSYLDDFKSCNMPNRVHITTSCCQINCGGQGDIAINVQHTKPPKINHDLVANICERPSLYMSANLGGFTWHHRKHDATSCSWLLRGRWIFWRQSHLFQICRHLERFAFSYYLRSRKATKPGFMCRLWLNSLLSGWTCWLCSKFETFGVLKAFLFQ